MALVQRIQPQDLLAETRPLPTRELADVAGSDRTELEQRLAVEHHLGAWLAAEQRREVGRVHHAAVRAIRRTGMLGQPLRVTPDDDPLAVHADRDRRTHLGDRHRVAVAEHRHQRPAADLAGVGEPVVRRAQRERPHPWPPPPPAAPVALRRWPAMGACWRTSATPRTARQVGVIGEHAPGQEVALDPLHQRLDAALLVARPPASTPRGGSRIRPPTAAAPDARSAAAGRHARSSPSSCCRRPAPRAPSPAPGRSPPAPGTASPGASPS